MSKQKKAVFLLSLFSLVALIAACTNQPQKETVSTKKEEITLAAAASLESVMEKKIIPAFEKEHPDIQVTGTYDSSGKLQMQSVVPLLENQLVLIVPNQDQAKWHDFSDLKKAQMIAIGDPASVPAGQYAEEGLKALGAWSYVEKHASFGTNVTEVLEWVANASAEAGLVYATDAATNSKVAIVAAMPEAALKKPIIYPVGKVAASKKQKSADAFLNFLQSQQCRKYFDNIGFKLTK